MLKCLQNALKCVVNKLCTQLFSTEHTLRWTVYTEIYFVYSSVLYILCLYTQVYTQVYYIDSGKYSPGWPRLYKLSSDPITSLPFIIVAKKWELKEPGSRPFSGNIQKNTKVWKAWKLNIVDIDQTKWNFFFQFLFLYEQECGPQGNRLSTGLISIFNI